MTTTDARLDADVLLATAVEQTGLDDFGPDTLPRGLERLLRVGRRRGAAQRPRRGGRARQHRRSPSPTGCGSSTGPTQHPEVADERIEAPFVVDRHVPRRHHAPQLPARPGPAPTAPLLRWEAGDSVPPPTPDDHRSGPRVDAVARRQRRCSTQINPRIKVVQHEEPDGPTECISVLSQDFKSLTWEAIANVPTLRRVAARRRPALGLRVPPPCCRCCRAAACGPVDAEEPAPRDRASTRSPPCTPTPASCCMHRDPVVLSRVGVQPHHDALGHVHRRRPPRVHRRALDRHARASRSTRIDAFRDAHPEQPIVDVQYADLVARPARHDGNGSTARSATSSTGQALRRDAGPRRRPTRRASSARTATTSPSSASTARRWPSASPATSSATRSRSSHLARRRARPGGRSQPQAGANPRHGHMGETMSTPQGEPRSRSRGDASGGGRRRRRAARPRLRRRGVLERTRQRRRSG